MNNKLTKEEVLHVAHLARIGIDESEIEKYQLTLAQMIDEIDKIKDLDDFDDNIMISPSENNVNRQNVNNEVPTEELLKNVPHKEGNFVKVPVMINE